MQQVIADQNQLKDILKQALVELLHEQRSFLYDVFAEVLEDIALASAIKEGEETEAVTRSEIIHILESES